MKHSGGDDWQAGGFGLYVHWPYCLSKCPYCDFNSHVAASIDQAAWADAYEAELQRVAALAPDRVLQTIYFGGGTPSLMDPAVVDRVISTARKVWRGANDIEMTLEANPTSIEAGKLSAFKEAGVNRISMGMQAMNDEDLRRLGRTHSAQEARKAYETACSIFDRVTFDLIYARQFQTTDQWRAELREALAMQTGHLSLYQLTIEDGTVFGARFAQGKLKGLPSDDLGAEFYEITQEMCEAAGLPAYEVSNHARPGQESRHNLIYWRSGDYAGIGPGAHGRLTLGGQRIATAAPRAPQDWLTAVQSGQMNDVDEVLATEDLATEFLLMGLRLRDGVDLERFERLAGQSLPQGVLAELQELQLIEVEDRTLRTTAKGRPLLNAILLKLIEAL